jgi:hypothetical protein
MLRSSIWPSSQRPPFRAKTQSLPFFPGFDSADSHCNISSRRVVDRFVGQIELGSISRVDGEPEGKGFYGSSDCGGPGAFKQRTSPD